MSGCTRALGRRLALSTCACACECLRSRLNDFVSIADMRLRYSLGCQSVGFDLEKDEDSKDMSEEDKANANGGIQLWGWGSADSTKKDKREDVLVALDRDWKKYKQVCVRVGDSLRSVMLPGHTPWSLLQSMSPFMDTVHMVSSADHANLQMRLIC